MLIYITGFLSGILSGMGVGGGMILIPCLRFFFSLSQHASQCVNLIYYLPVGGAALFIHIKNKRIKFSLIFPVIIGGIVFSLVGAFIALRIKSDILAKLFALFIFVFGIKEVYAGFRKKTVK